MGKLAQRAVIAGAGVLAIISAVGGADLLGQAHADNPQCVANAMDPCPVLADAPNADPPHSPQVQTFCQPAGSKWGTHCFRRIAP
jgi:hypothetical protein